MNPIKIAFFDIDGTLIDLDLKRMTEPVKHTLLELQKQGVRLCIATGRGPMTIPRIQGITFDTYLTFNGSYCFDREGDIFSNPIPRQDVLTVIRNARSLGRTVSVATKTELGANGWEKDLSDYFEIANLHLEIAPDFDRLIGQDIYQMMIGSRPEEFDALLCGATGAKIAAWWGRAVDVIPSNGGKGVAVEKVLAHYGLKRDQAIAFGDGNNDLEMLRTVGTGVAMGNGSEELKAAANAVCRPVTEDGIYHFCLERGLIAPYTKGDTGC
ncbi:MAG: Cof-type HAD-IIB family hydrolase [Oscillospiraceae bacterium]|nr:Cof-type HAD-IIB family hydrolase [Oscillospiraceae bacterium]